MNPRRLLNSTRLQNSLFFLVILLLPTQLGRHFWPQFSYVYSLPIDYLSPTIYLWDILTALLLLTNLSWLRQRTALSILLTFLLLQLVSLINAPNIGAGLVRFEQLLITGLFGVYLSAQPKEKLLKKLKAPLLISLGGEAIIALGEFLLSGSLHLWILGERSFSVSTPGIAKFNFFGAEFLRPYATFPHPNVLAAYSTIIAGLLLYVIKDTSRLLVILASVLAVFLSFSRIGWLAFSTIIFQQLNRGWISNHRKMVMLLLLLVGPFIAVRFSSVINYDQLSFSRRGDLNSTALSMFLSHPLQGIGLNNFIPVLVDGTAVAGPSRFLQPVHNIPLLVLAETGMVGLVGLVVLLFFPLKKLWKQRHSDFSWMLFHLWLLLLTFSLFDHYLLTLAQGQRLLFFLWGLSMLQ